MDNQVSYDPSENAPEARIRHLEIIQNVIARMANNSFLLKGWSVTIVGALFAFSATENTHINIVVFSLLPAFTFWYLDGFYMRQERLFRKLYDDIVISLGESSDDQVPLFSLDTRKYEREIQGGLLKLLFARAVWPVHSVVVTAISGFLIAVFLGYLG